MGHILCPTTEVQTDLGQILLLGELEACLSIVGISGLFSLVGFFLFFFHNLSIIQLVCVFVVG